MMKRTILTLALTIVAAIAIAATGWFHQSNAAERKTSSGIFEVGKKYHILVGATAVRFEVVGIGAERSAGLIAVKSVEDASGIGIAKGTFWFLNPNNVLLTSGSYD